MLTLEPSDRPGCRRTPLFVLAGLVLFFAFAQSHVAHAQGARFFRISGPPPAEIIAFQLDGTLVWRNAVAPTNYLVQTTTALGGGTDWVDYIRIPVTAPDSINTNLLVSFNPPPGMNLVPAGLFTIGDAVDGNSWGHAPLTNVYVSGFYMDANLVSFSLWLTVYNWAVTHGYTFRNSGSGQGPSHPVHHVNWYDCVKWCNARSEMSGLHPVYYTDAELTQVYRAGELNEIHVFWNTNGFRLPTEAEWEKAARGGLAGRRYPWGDTISQAQANYYGCTSCHPYDLGPNFFNPAATVGSDQTSNFATTPVGSFAPNGYGLYDMAGNVKQWCWDWYRGDRPPGSPYLGGTDPHGPAIIGNRVLRGGSGVSYANSVGSAYRHNYNPKDFYGFIGFRSVCGLKGAARLYEASRAAEEKGGEVTEERPATAETSRNFE
jgi:formylglycine-generating enzyme